MVLSRYKTPKPPSLISVILQSLNFGVLIMANASGGTLNRFVRLRSSYEFWIVITPPVHGGCCNLVHYLTLSAEKLSAIADRRCQKTITRISICPPLYLNQASCGNCLAGFTSIHGLPRTGNQSRQKLVQCCFWCVYNYRIRCIRKIWQVLCVIRYKLYDQM